MQPARVVAGTLVVLGAVLVAFFVTFNALFSDRATSWVAPERLMVFALIIVAHGGLAAAGSKWAGSRWWTWALVVAAPSILISVLYLTKETNIIGFALAGIVLAAIASVAGAWLAPRAKLAE